MGIDDAPGLPGLDIAAGRRGLAGQHVLEQQPVGRQLGRRQTDVERAALEFERVVGPVEVQLQRDVVGVEAQAQDGSGLSFLIFLGFERAAFLRHTDFYARCALWPRRGSVGVLAVVGIRHIWWRGHGARSSLTRCKQQRRRRHDVLDARYRRGTPGCCTPVVRMVATVDDDDVGVQCVAPAARPEEE